MKALACVNMGESEGAVLDGFRRAGLAMDETKVEELTKEKLAEDDYLFVFSVNFSPDISAVCQDALMPYFSYIMELPQREIYLPEMKNPCNFIFCFDRAICQELKGLVPERIFHLPLGVGEMSDLTCGQSEISSEVSFVGSLYEHDKGIEVLTKTNDMSEYVRGYLESLLKVQVRIYGFDLLKEALENEVFQELKKMLPEDILQGVSEENEKKMLAGNILAGRVTQMERQKLLQAVSERFDTHIYTESKGKAIPAAHIHNGAVTEDERIKIYQNSQINLHMTHRGIASGVPQEVYSIMAAGGFVLTNFQPEIMENFVIGEHLETFMNEEEMIEKIAYYLEHAEERERIAKAGQQMVLENHTYFTRAVTMFNTVFSDE